MRTTPKLMIRTTFRVVIRFKVQHQAAKSQPLESTIRSGNEYLRHDFPRSDLLLAGKEAVFSMPQVANNGGHLDKAAA